MEFRLSTHWLPALINNDYSGLTDEDCTALDSFADDCGHGYWVVPDDENYFGRDDVTGLMANVVDVEFVPLDA
jgi:hypothetical protein